MSKRWDRRLSEVQYLPWKKVIIHEAIQYPLEQMITMRVIGVAPGQLGRRLLWANGVVFHFSLLPPTAEIIKESLAGNIHWSSVEWSEMPEYKLFIEIQPTRVKIPVIDVSKNANLSKIAQWLLDNKGKL